MTSLDLYDSLRNNLLFKDAYKFVKYLLKNYFMYIKYFYLKQE